MGNVGEFGEFWEIWGFLPLFFGWWQRKENIPSQLLKLSDSLERKRKWGMLVNWGNMGILTFIFWVVAEEKNIPILYSVK